MTKNNIITGVLLIAACIAVAMHFKQDSELRRLQAERFQQVNNDLLEQLQRAESRLQREASYRDSLTRTLDSVSLLVGGLTAYNLKLKREIASIPGRYDHVEVDSLGALMNSRADASR